MIDNLMSLPDWTPETATVELPRLGLRWTLRELSYDTLARVRREKEADLHLILEATVTPDNLRSDGWYHGKMGCATPVDALKKLLRPGEITRMCRVIDKLNGFYGSVLELSEDELQGQAIAKAAEELEKN